MANDTVEQAVLDTMKVARVVKKTYGRTSLTRSAKDTIAMYPAIFSADIPTEEATVIAKGLEAQYAALLVSVISANSDFNRKDYPNAAAYLKVFHNNSNIPGILQAAAIEADLSMDKAGPMEITHAYLCPNAGKFVGKDVVMECWNGTTIPFPTDTLNHVYEPAVATQTVMESIAADLRSQHKPAMEEMSDLEYTLTKGQKGVDPSAIGAPTGRTETIKDTKKVPVKDETTGDIVRDKKGNPVLAPSTTTKMVRGASSTGNQGIVRNDRMTNMEPTMINVQLNSHQGEGGAVITHNLVIGVKVMAQCVPSSLMVSNLAEGVLGSRAMFAWIKWTKGQYSFIKDFLLGVNNAKQMAVRDRDMRHWLASLQRRKMSDKISATTDGSRIPPITTVICTTYEVDKVKELTGVDLNDSYAAMKLLSKYYMLGFVIYDTSNGRIKAIFESDTQFSNLTLNGLRTKTQKESDLTQLTQFMRLAGKN